MWSEQYAIIGYINNILAHLDERPDLTLHDYYRGEMLGLRAFLHFDLLRLFARPTSRPKASLRDHVFLRREAVLHRGRSL